MRVLHAAADGQVFAGRLQLFHARFSLLPPSRHLAAASWRRPWRGGVDASGLFVEWAWARRGISKATARAVQSFFMVIPFR